ncbi:hypothetical protein AB0G73_16030 [Streptomyces sp. NPDC020719]|uniref:hypothetical protein n=1 Tax=Streptomyces sp. NPDC020719 TaxID=3154896 RepID=UPI0033E264AA
MPGKAADFLHVAELVDAERAALDQGVRVRRGQGYTLRVSAALSVHRQPLDGTPDVPAIPAQREARRDAERTPRYPDEGVEIILLPLRHVSRSPPHHLVPAGHLPTSPPIRRTSPC